MVLVSGSLKVVLGDSGRAPRGEMFGVLVLPGLSCCWLGREDVITLRPCGVGGGVLPALIVFPGLTCPATCHLVLRPWHYTVLQCMNFLGLRKLAIQKEPHNVDHSLINSSVSN